MTITASSLLEQAATQLQDDDHVRWPLPELLVYLNAGLRETLWVQPVAFRQWRIIELDEGPRQVVDDAYQVLALTGNIASGDYDDGITRGKAVRQTSLERLNFYAPDWHSESAEASVREYMLDTVDRQSFWVYPPNDGSGKVEAKLIATPQTLDEPSDPDTLSSYDSLDIEMEGVYAPALVYYILSRAWAKDTDFAGNLELSTRYYNLFKSVLATGADPGEQED